MVSENDNNVRAVGFEQFVRDHPNVKRLASLWRHDPKYEAWMKLYTSEDNSTVEYYEEENHQVGTFYRALTDAEIKAQERIKVDALAAETEVTVPTHNDYEVLAVTHEHADDVQEHRVWHVKLGRPRWVASNDKRYAWVEYVFVDQFINRWRDKDENLIVDARTRVIATDLEQEDYQDNLEAIYIVPAFLGVQECMWAIGEYPILDNNITEE